MFVSTSSYEKLSIYELSLLALDSYLLRHRCSVPSQPWTGNELKYASNPEIIALSSACDYDVTYHGWMFYCTTKAAITRFVQTLAHEEPLICVQGLYPKLTRTKMPEDVITGKYKGVMADHEIERFRIWNEIGGEVVEPAHLCGEAVGKLALGLYRGGASGETFYHDEHVPKKI